ncbi:MAG: hypothetical protein MRY63_09555 [Neomegalonema sp.]|nr:hypothetical protein [Neomegalonema sp.]
MSLRIEADPSRPYAGQALLVLAGAEPGRSVRVVLQRREDDQFLSMNAGGASWGAARGELGSFKVVSLASGQPGVVLGPQICNHLEPFQSLIVEVPELAIARHVAWPEDIGKGEAVLGSGAIHANRGADVLEAQNVRVEPATEPPAPPLAQEAAKERASPPPLPGTSAEPQTGAEPRGAKPWMLLLPLAALLLIGGGLYLLRDQIFPPSVAEQAQAEQEQAQAEQEQAEQGLGEPEQSGEPPVTAPVSEERAAPDPCAAGSAATLADILSTCLASGQEGALEKAARIVERGVIAAEPSALMQRAKWYDPSQAAAPSPYPSRNLGFAVRNYRQARDAGLADAGPLLEAACAALERDTGLVARTIHAKNCQ